MTLDRCPPIQIRVSLDRPRHHVSEKFFGLHLEHIWNCVYPCVWVGPDSPIPNTDGIRRDTARLLAELRPAVCKYPGGYFTDFYDWRDGVGPRAARRARVYPNEPGRVEPNQFGTAEFVTFCRLIGAEPYLSVNTTSIGPDDAAHWVEYCNSDGDTYWATRRRADGFPKPFNVHYWAIGNEPYWMHSAGEYAERYRRWVHWMYNTDPSIAVVAGGVGPGTCVGEPWNTDGKWGERFLKLTRAASGLMGNSWHPGPADREILYSIHPYFWASPDCTPQEYMAAFAELESLIKYKRAILTLAMSEGSILERFGIEVMEEP